MEYHNYHKLESQRKKTEIERQELLRVLKLFQLRNFGADDLF